MFLNTIFISYTIYKKQCFVCVKVKSPRDVSFTHIKHLFDWKKTDNNSFLVVYIRMSNSLV